MHAVREEAVKLRRVGFVKQVGLKPEVKERGSYGCAVQNGESEKKDVTGEGISESEMEELVTE